jgi:hypothetical protein
VAPGTFHRVHSLTNTFSGVAGEARIAAELVRCGLRVAKPYWTDDESDLLVLHVSANALVPIAIQVKSVQFLTKQDKVFLQGLKKRYVTKYLTKSEGFALAIYRVDSDEIFFVDGPQLIVDIYEKQAVWNNKHIAFDDLDDNKDIRLAIFEDKGLGGEYFVPRDNPSLLTWKFDAIAKRVTDAKQEVATLSLLWSTTDSPPSVDGGAEEDHGPAEAQPGETEETL